MVKEIKELVWHRTNLPEEKRKRLVLSQSVPMNAIALVQGKQWRQQEAARGRTASSSAGADLCQVQPVREIGDRSQVPLSTWEVHFRFNLLPPAYVHTAATVVTV